MKLIVTGAGGQLGRSVVKAAEERGFEVLGLMHRDLDVSDVDAVRRVIASEQPDFVVHCAAWTDVDGCEADPERADRQNGHATAYVAEACLANGAGLVYISTDFVFDGTSSEPYQEEAETCPVSAYGRSKRLGEQAVLRDETAGFYVLRTSWVFGPGGKNFPKAILSRAQKGEPLRVVDDQVGSPSYAPDLALAILDLIATAAPAGVYHASNQGSCSWHQFAVDLLEASELDIDASASVGTMSSAELDRPAARPAYSVLDTSRLSGLRGTELPPYRDAINRYLSEESS